MLYQGNKRVVFYGHAAWPDQELGPVENVVFAWDDSTTKDHRDTVEVPVGEPVRDEHGLVVGTMQADGVVKRLEQLEAAAPALPRARAIDLKKEVIR